MTMTVLLGLLLTPVSCTLVDHPHSLFDTPDALQRSGHAAHAAHASQMQTGATHLAMMVHGAPPLAGAIPLPDLHPGTVVAWLTAEAASVAGSRAPGTPPVPGIESLPSVSSMAMSMVATGLAALHVAQLLLLVAALIAVRQVAVAARLTGQSLATIVPPPRRISPI